ncbi:MAG: VanZ like family protein [Chloroflexi bacterium ADurb.Bin325]|nr:MAG: VanZ like family protein [Chloroflexi bacterium ADurb.Bin325]
MKRRGAWLRGLAWAATLLVALWILSLTLVEREQPGSINLTPFSRKLPALACLRGGCELPDERNAAAIFLLVDVLGNIAVFVPFGMALAAATFPRRRRGQRGRHFGGRWWGRVLLAGFLFSLSIEVAQLSLKSRATDIDDIILNTLGAVIGAAFVRLFSVLLR